MTREQTYTQQLQELGIYEPAFEPEIHTLAIMERDLQRALKAWKATAEKGEQPSVTDPIWAAICSLRRDILAHRDALGLTPKALQRLRAKTESAGAVSEQSAICSRLDRILDEVNSYEGTA